jgi:hypothetical protein
MRGLPDGACSAIPCPHGPTLSGTDFRRQLAMPYRSMPEASTEICVPGATITAPDNELRKKRVTRELATPGIMLTVRAMRALRH